MIKINLDKLIYTDLHLKRPSKLCIALLFLTNFHHIAEADTMGPPRYIYNRSPNYSAGAIMVDDGSPEVSASKQCAVWGWRGVYTGPRNNGWMHNFECYQGSILQSGGVSFKVGVCPPYHDQNGVGIPITHPDGWTTGFASCYLEGLDHAKNAGNPGCLTAGNPINMATGNKYHAESVYKSTTLNPLAFDFNYNSKWKTIGFTPNWQHNYNKSLFIWGESSEYASLTASDGRVITFKFLNNTWQPDSIVSDKLIELKDNAGNRIGWKFNVDFTGDIETYDTDGRLYSITDRAGLTQTMVYSTSATAASIAPFSGLLINVTNSIGNMLKFVYGSSGEMSKMIDASGATFSFVYNSSKNLRQVTFPDGIIKLFLYENTVFPEALTGITDENGVRFSTFTYDNTYTYSNKGRAISSEHANAVEKTSLVYNADGFGMPISTAVTDSRGSVRTYNFTTILGVVKSTGQSQPGGAGCAASASAITYDANGNVASRADFNGNMTTFSYDMTRNLETRRTEGLNAAGAATAATRTITTTWHPTWRLPLVTSEFSGATATGTALRRTTNVYDAKGNITSITEADPVRNLTRTTTMTYTYSSLVPGLVLSKVVNGPRTDVTDTTTFNYYDANATCTPSSAAPLIDPITNTSPPNLGCRGQLQSMANALGQTTTYDRYNHHGQIEQMTDANGLVTTSTYDLRQRLLTRTVGTETTSLTYDNVGQVTQLTMPDNSQLTYTYDAAHRLTEVQDNLGNKVTYTLDSEGNRINETTTDTNNVLTKTLTRSYDALNRLQQVVGVE